MTIAWSEVYGINWSAKIPVPGAQVTFQGLWQSCSLRQAYTLNAEGWWDPNSDGKAGWMTAVNHFQDIFFSESLLPVQGTGSWLPTEVIQLYYGVRQNTGFVVSDIKTQIEKYDMSQTVEQNYFHWFEWHHSTGEWSDRDSPFPVAGRPDTLLPPTVRWITFGIGITAIAPFINKFRVKMNERGWVASITAQGPGGITFKVIAEKIQKDKGDTSDNIDQDIEEILMGLSKDGTLPNGETWKITP